MRRNEQIYIMIWTFLTYTICSQAQTLQVSLSPDKSKVDRNAKEGMATIYFESSVEDLCIVCKDENPNEPIDKVGNNLWRTRINVKKDLDTEGVCYRNFLLKSPSSAEFHLTTESIRAKQVLYYTVFLPKIAGGVPLNVDVSFDPGFDSGIEGAMGSLITLPEWRMGHLKDTLIVYRNLKQYQYDQLYSITPKDLLYNVKGVINNVNVGDILTFSPVGESYETLSIKINQIPKSNEIIIPIKKKRDSIHGYVIDDYLQKPIQNCKVLLYLGNYEDSKSDRLYNGHWGYYKFYETRESCGDYSTERNGLFKFDNCVIDYTYYITAKPPRGYARIGFNEGVNIKPKDNMNESLTIRIKPLIFNGFVTDGKKAISDIEIECETLYGKKNITTGQDGRFEIIGPTSEFIRFKHDEYRIMDVKFDEYSVQNEDCNITIKMRKGNYKKPFKGEYKRGEIKEIK